MNTQAKFEKALESVAKTHEVDLVIDKTYANLGTYSFEKPASFDPVMKFPFSWSNGSASFDHRNTHDRDTNTLTSYVGPQKAAGGPPWIAVSGVELDRALRLISVILGGLVEERKEDELKELVDDLTS